MTQDEIIDLARQVGFYVRMFNSIDGDEVVVEDYIITEKLEYFAKLVAAKEREACAKLCEEAQTYSMPISCPDGISGCLVAHYIPARREKTGSEAAAAIRARGET